MKVLMALMVVCWLASCAPLPLEPTQTGQLPEFTVLTAVPSIGDLDYSVSAEGHLEGALTLKQQVSTTHPLRVAVIWLEPQFTSFTQKYWSSLLLQADQQLLLSASAGAGTYAFSGELVAPAAAMQVVRSAACIGGEDKNARAVLVAFVDTNDNGVLDLANGPAVDHVLSSTDFPPLLLGDQRSVNELGFKSCSTASFWSNKSHLNQAVYDDPHLDLVACQREDRFAVDGACGISNDSPAIEFGGTREDDLVSVGVNAYRAEVVIILDNDAQRAFAGTPNSTTVEFKGPELGVGSHRIRAERRGMVVWEATFTLPDRTWVREVRTAPGGSFDVHFQEVAGAFQYDVIASRTLTGFGASSPVRIEANGINQGAELDSIGLTARFATLPFTSGSFQKRPR